MGGRTGRDGEALRCLELDERELERLGGSIESSSGGVWPSSS